MRAWIGALLIRKRYVGTMLLKLELADERIHRLEIAHRTYTERLEVLESSQDRLWAKWKGDRGGRPRGVSADPDPLAAIPIGDKAALRAHLLPVKTNR